ncbi:MAG: DNA polymerase III subunit delta [Prevotellaceae bacterium]|jgi:DNA polymerase-3 subunit delta|nr:DNA polymerase III subunit delta [Prevotellaceae bacterium]
MAKMKLKDITEKCESIVSDLKKKIYKPVYVLAGEEPYYIDRIADYIADNVLSESEKVFDRLILYGKDTDAKTVVFAAACPPMTASRRVVVVKEAQHLKLEDMATYLKSPLPTTILALCLKGKTLDKRLKLYKELEAKAVIFETAKPYDNELAQWITNYLKGKGAGIEPAAAAILADHIGADLSRIVNELDKLFTLLPENNRTITGEHIERNIGISKEYNAFELCDAIMTKNVLKANRIVDYFGKNPNANPMTLIIASIFAQFVRLFKYHVVKVRHRDMPPNQKASIVGVHPFLMRDYESASTRYSFSKVVGVIALLREYDMKSKGLNSAAPEAELLRELVFKIMH